VATPVRAVPTPDPGRRIDCDHVNLPHTSVTMQPGGNQTEGLPTGLRHPHPPGVIGEHPAHPLA